MEQFLLGLPPHLKEAIRDRAKIENRTQSDLIREAITSFLLTPHIKKKPAINLLK